MQEVGEVLAPWSQGCLDIHHINTGRGDAAFLILPDGTTLMVDAGEMKPSSSQLGRQRKAQARPDDSRPAWEWIVRYVRRYAPQGSDPTLDYFLLTHFHDDHMGDASAGAPLASNGAYRLSGVTGVGDAIPIGQLIDRGYPDYDYAISINDPRVDAWVAGSPARLAGVAALRANMANYRAFQEWQGRERGMRVSQLEAGRADQIVPCKEPERYPTLQVRSVCCNGQVWTGVGDVAVGHYPPVDSLPPETLPNENACCAGIRITYGRFSYLTTGDLIGDVDPGGSTWLDLETPVAKAVGPTDVIASNHHGHRNSMNGFLLSAVRPRVIIHQTWSADHPGQPSLARMRSRHLYPGPRDMYATNLLETTKIFHGPTLEPSYTASEGHIVVRVQPGGAEYAVYALSDRDESGRITVVGGPYNSS